MNAFKKSIAENDHESLRALMEQANTIRKILKQP
jgi:hypothetical protein